MRVAATMLCACLLPVLPGPALADILIDFDTLPGGGTPQQLAEIRDAYASLGVDFGQSLESDDRGTAIFRLDSGLEAEFSAMDALRGPGDEVGFHVLATFSRPVASIAADAFAPSSSVFSVIMTAYDFEGSPLASIESDPVFGAFKGNLALDGVGEIHSVSWISNDPFYAGVSIDDLSYAFVPEPSTGALLALGLASLGVARRRGPVEHPGAASRV